MNKDKLNINREACKRMLHKNMDLDYIKEITSLSKKQIKNINDINNSFVGENEYNLRKEYASKINLNQGYYFSNRALFYTGVDLDKSDFYKNIYVQKDHYDLIEDIELMKKKYANSLRISVMFKMINYLKDYNNLIECCKLPYSLPDITFKYPQIYYEIKMKMEAFEQKKIILSLLSSEENIKKIAFICNVDENFVDEVKKDNKIFFKKNKLNITKLTDIKNQWEKELEYEIAKRSAKDIYFDEYKVFNIDLKELKEFKKEAYDKRSAVYEYRKEIVEKLMPDSHSIKVISEISGITEYFVDSIVDFPVYNRYFEKYYEKYANESLIEFKI